MKENESEKLTINDIINKWLYILKQEGGVRYLYRERKEHIEALISWFKQSGVSLEEAKTVKNQVLRSFITEEGIKGKGKYKGWKENILFDFDTILANYYVDFNQEKKVEKENPFYLKDDEIIKEWVVDKYGDYYNLIKETQTVGSDLFFKFVEEKYN